MEIPKHIVEMVSEAVRTEDWTEIDKLDAHDFGAVLVYLGQLAGYIVQTRGHTCALRIEDHPGHVTTADDCKRCLAERIQEAVWETEAVTSDSDLMRQVAASEAELANGEIVTAEDLGEVMERRI